MGNPHHLGGPATAVALVELLVLCGFAIAQALLDVTGQSPDFLLFRRPTGSTSCCW